jgi:hypothetical protein
VQELIKDSYDKFGMMVKFMFDYFWQVVVGNTPSHLTRRVLEWFGYDGEVYVQKQNFVRMLKTNKITYTELTQHDNQIELYPTIKDASPLLNRPHRGPIAFLVAKT